MYKTYCQYLKQAESKGRLRKLLEDPSKSLIDFSTNDYLGLSKSVMLLRAAISAGENFGVGATGSRLLSGNRSIFEELESKIARDKKTETALIFNSGYQANITALASLLDQKVLKHNPLVFFDRLNHSSLYQAAFLSKADLIRYNHNDMNHLNDLLIEHRNDTRDKFIVTESIFGMDGDVLHIDEIVKLSNDHDAFLYLDEAHATGVIGLHGYGLSTNVDLSQIRHLVMGTFSKALGCSGAYVACSNLIKDFLINRCPGFIYSTGPSPMVVGAASIAWDEVRNLGRQRQALFAKADELRSNLDELGFNVGSSSTHILPVILGGEISVMDAKCKLLEEGLIVSAVRPPTVLPGTSRLRIALNLNHTDSDLDRLVTALKTMK